MSPSLDESLLPGLISKAQEGDTESFGKVYDHFFLPVYRYVSFRAPAETVEDIVSEIFVKVWEKLHTYKVQRGVPFGAWLFRIARHTVIDTYRAQRGIVVGEVPEEIMDTDELNRADTDVKRKDTLSIVQKAVDALPNRYREILVLSYIAELPHREVARVLRLTEGAVRILKMRALRKFEQNLPPDMRSRP